MNEQERNTYLREPGRFAAVAALRRDGTPFTIPMGHYYDGEYLYPSTTAQRGLTHRLRRDPRISVSVFDHEAIRGYVVVNGVAEETDDPDNRLSLAMHHRYPKPGLDSVEQDEVWLPVPRGVFRISTAEAFGMDQRKASGSLWALAMPDVRLPGS